MRLCEDQHESVLSVTFQFLFGQLPVAYILDNPFLFHALSMFKSSRPVQRDSLQFALTIWPGLNILECDVMFTNFGIQVQPGVEG